MITKLDLDIEIANQYKSPSQKIRVMSEVWVNKNVFCPNCGKIVKKYSNNKPVADFFCEICKEDFELKSKKNNFGKKIVDGAYKTMIDRLSSQENPNFYFLTYDREYKVTNFFIIPKQFFTPSIIEKRKPLSSNTRRVGWIGCNILLDKIPNIGKIFYIKNKKVYEKNIILKKWKQTLFLRNYKNIELRGWTLDIMKCIENLNKKEFSLKEIYYFEKYLAEKYPNNKHIKDKIRQQLQILRDKEILDFVGQGKYILKV